MSVANQADEDKEHAPTVFAYWHGAEQAAERQRAAAAAADLRQRLANHISQMAPYLRTFESGRLLIEAAAALGAPHGAP